MNRKSKTSRNRHLKLLLVPKANNLTSTLITYLKLLLLSLYPSLRHPRSLKKPAWAVTEKQTEDAKEAEIDDLLEFAYELDYEKFMEDEEVRIALGAIKSRVDKMTAENNWQENMAEEWNQAQA